jgi:hypothetical protein
MDKASGFPSCNASSPAGDAMKQSDHFRENAKNCSQLAERSTSTDPTYLRYKRMEAAWRALAHEPDWLDGSIAPNVRRFSSRAPGTITF